MRLDAHLDLGLIAVESDDSVSLLVELTAPSAPGTSDRPPATLQVVLDRSGSMSGGRLHAAQRALVALVDRLDPQDRFGVVAFDDSAQVVVPCGPLVDKEQAKAAIRAVAPGGSTDLSGGLLRGLQEVRRAAGEDSATLVLVSDGHANAGVTDPERLHAVADGARRRGTTVTTLGMGLGYDEELLAGIAQGGGGAEHFAEEPDAAEAALAAECDGLLAQTAQAVSLLVRTGPAVAGVVLHNDLPAQQLPEGVLVELGAMVADETRKLALTLRVPAVAALGLLKIAELELRWVELPALVEHVATLPVSVNVVPGDQAAGRQADPTVRAEVAYLTAQKAKRDASRALRHGDAAGAARALDLADAALMGIAAHADERLLLNELREEAVHGDSSRASKRMTSDANRKSRYHGRYES